MEWDRKKYEYLAAFRWDKFGTPLLTVQDRKQQNEVTFSVDPTTGTTTNVLTRTDPAWVEIEPNLPRWSKDGKGLIYIDYAARGAKELYVRRPGGQPRRITDSGNRFGGVFHLNIDRGSLYYVWHAVPGTATFEKMALEDTGFPKQFNDYYLHDSCTSYSAVPSQDDSHYVLTWGYNNAMPRSLVFRADKPKPHPNLARSFPLGTEIAELPSVALEPDVWTTIHQDWAPANEKGMGFDDSKSFQTAILRPRDFDKTKKYPVIVDVYGGPKHLSVVDAMRPWLLMQWLADQGFIIVAIDNRGTPNRNHDWEKSIYQKFDSVPLEDQIKGLKALANRYPQMDMDRVGIVGWSFGGYMSALAVLKRPDVFKAAVAGAPVTDWEDYDTHYTERYLGLLPESQKVYDDANLVKMADKLTRPLLLIHGTADDNVYFRHTLKLSDALFRAGKDFDVLPLPSLTHQVPDPVVMERMWTKIAGHFQKHLGKAK
ncbi:MAG: S9 family peptidase [Planctomycetes bacterium]|nr:S9 family peptidase [Planctomycetota bacterium]